MPVQMFQHLSDREVRDITAFVRTLAHVPNPGLKPSWFTPAARREIETYGGADFERLMRTGKVPGGKDTKTGFMSEVARDRFAPSLTPREIAALKAFLDAR